MRPETKPANRSRIPTSSWPIRVFHLALPGSREVELRVLGKLTRKDFESVRKFLDVAVKAANDPESWLDKERA